MFISPPTFKKFNHKPTLVPFCLGIRQHSPTFAAMPAPSIGYYNAAVDAIQAGRLDEALSAAENSLTENPKDAETWQLYVIVLNALGRHEEARKATEKLEQIGLGEADGFLLKAAEAASSGDLTAVIAHYESALETGGERTEIHSGYALALMESGMPDEALAAARKAVSLAPSDGRANYALGHVLRLRKEKDEALSALTKAVAAEPDLMLAVYEQGTLLVEVDRLEEALENFSRYLKTHPGDPGARQAIEGIHYRMRPETR
jgi:tetratricopeptide (TPR) repeat protein